MKKIVSLVMVCALCLAVMLAATSCSMLGIYLLNGTYENEGVDLGILGNLGESSISFKLNGDVAYTVGNKTYAGEYEIEKLADDSLQIDLDFEDDCILEGEHKFVQGEANGSKYIEIGGVKYTKTK